ncbi:MAG: NAD(P)H-dependent oxidoreductase [Pseudomonadota bacterium]
MSKIMYIKASPRGERSHSIAVADRFIKACRAADPGVEILERDLFAMDLPPLDGPTLVGKYNIMHGRPFSEADKKAWSGVEAVIEDFKSADKYVFAIPMWNFSLPYRLKHFMDIVAQPTYTFVPEGGGYKGLINAPAFIAYARGGDYPEGSPYNFQEDYMTFYLGFIGITDVKSVAVQPTLAGDGPRDASKAQAIEKALEIARTF